MAKTRKFYNLDNSAKIFPAVASVNRSYMFRLSAVLFEDINKEALQKAVTTTTKRFVNFNVKIGNGLFWHFFEKNLKSPKVFSESAFINAYLIPSENNDFLFRTLYYEKRISIEFFHALTDGAGALEFFNAVLFEYLLEIGKKVSSDFLIRTKDEEFRYDELTDKFQDLYDEKVKVNRSEPNAYHLRGTRYQYGYLAVMHANMSVSKVKEVCRKYNTTITALLSALIIYSYLKSDESNKVYKKPFRLIIPVNMRKYFDTATMRNFASFIRINFDLNNKDISFDEVMKMVNGEFEYELDINKMHERMISNVRFERNWVNRIAPLFIKKLAMKAVYGLIGEAMNSFALSNLGVVKLPDSMKEYISHYQFIIGASPSVVKSASVISYEDNLVFTFTSCIIERKIEKVFFETIKQLGLETTIESNNWEVLD